MKYKINYTDSSWLFFTPFAFLNMGGTNHWTIMQKRHWWNKWEKVGYTYDRPEDAYIEYFKLKHNLEIKKGIEFPHNRNKNKTDWDDKPIKGVYIKQVTKVEEIKTGKVIYEK